MPLTSRCFFSKSSWFSAVPLATAKFAPYRKSSFLAGDFACRYAGQYGYPSLFTARASMLVYVRH
jgi:hypothetical protein